MINKSIIRIVTVTFLFYSTSHAGMVTSTDYNASKEAAGDVHVIDFEDAGPPHTTTSMSSKGFTFTSSNIFLITGDRSDASQNGTLILYNVGRTSVTMTLDGGGVFDLLMADLGEGTLEAPSTSILVTGFFSDGGSISELLNFDEVLPDFETVSFTGFSNLSSINFEAFGGSERFSLDNIVVPEPGTLMLMVVGASLVIWRKR